MKYLDKMVSDEYGDKLIKYSNYERIFFDDMAWYYKENPHPNK